MQQANVFDKSVLVNAIYGAGFPSMQHAVMAEREGYARFTGNQHNEEWQWDRDRLRHMADADLKALYGAIVGKAQ